MLHIYIYIYIYIYDISSLRVNGDENVHTNGARHAKPDEKIDRKYIGILYMRLL